jgi:hypothetical protein
MEDSVAMFVLDEDVVFVQMCHAVGITKFTDAE